MGHSVIVCTLGTDGFVNPKPDKVLTIKGAPYTWLFPRMKVIIHHGGSGTTHEALRAGRPQIIVPFVAYNRIMKMTEQEFWGSMVSRLMFAVYIHMYIQRFSRISY